MGNLFGTIGAGIMVIQYFRGFGCLNENEKKLIEQIYAKVCEIEKTVDRVEDSLDRVGSKMGHLSGEETSTSVEGKLNDVKSVYKDLQNTFTEGFADVHKGLAEIKEINKNRKTAKEIVEGIAGNGQKKSGKQVH